MLRDLLFLYRVKVRCLPLDSGEEGKRKKGVVDCTGEQGGDQNDVELRERSLMVGGGAGGGAGGGQAADTRDVADLLAQ
jgi:hypothetical protein